MANQRRHPRVKAKGVGGSLKVGNAVAAHGFAIENISLGGVFVRTPSPLPVGLALEMELKSTRLKKGLVLRGRVVSSLDAKRAAGATPGMGIHFDAMSEAQARALAQLVADLGGPSAAIAAPSVQAVSASPALLDDATQRHRSEAFDYGFTSLAGSDDFEAQAEDGASALPLIEGEEVRPEEQPVAVPDKEKLELQVRGLLLDLSDRSAALQSKDKQIELLRRELAETQRALKEARARLARYER